MAANKRSSISKADSLEKMGEFWDTHDFTEYDDPNAPDADFTVTCAVPIALDIFEAVEQYAHRQGIGVETLINLWVQKKLAEEAQTTEDRESE
ncbi:MAG: hypothetical protein HY710_12850 [Candidatus Latescibacteria bacterium]|nr:hypothetical protein [Candidatus Latescibacterota bacterium]